MGVCYDYASSVLLCAEDKSSILDFDEEDATAINGESLASGISKIYDQKTIFFRDFFMLFPLQTEECLFSLIEKESDHLPASDYVKRLRSGALNISVRNDAVDWILKVHAYYSFGPLSAYLSVNYLDRFLSAYELPQEKTWMTQLLAVACLSLAAKMEETEVPLSLDLQIGNARHVFEAKTIQRMELLVLSTLKWRMQSITPFSFIDYFLLKYNNASSLKGHEMSRCVELILRTIRGIGYLEFKPSEVAAAVALTAFSDDQIVNMEIALNCCPHVEKKRVKLCYDTVQKDVGPAVGVPPSISSEPRSPMGVLDAKCLSYKSDQTYCSPSNSPGNFVSAKKRKMNGS